MTFPDSHAGYVAVVGRPNVGKSTLINHILGQKIAITSKKPQTTRHALLGIHTIDHDQIVFIDTPGIHKDSIKAINRHMNRAAWQSTDFVDIIVQVSEAGKWTEEDEHISNKIAAQKQIKLHIVNKIDKLADKSQLLGELSRLHALGRWQEIIPVSAVKKLNLPDLVNTLRRLLPAQPWLFSEEQITTAGMRFIAAEILREKLFRYLHQEIPYALGVIIERYEEQAQLVKIDATIMVEREGQKGIVIGKGGKMLRMIGTNARLDLEKMLDKKVMLRNFVKVKENWSDNETIINSMGHGNNIDI